jgi:hypothetical protein
MVTSVLEEPVTSIVYPEGGDGRFCQNVGEHMQDHMTSQSLTAVQRTPLTELTVLLLGVAALGSRK